jgi:multidrug efflux pump subunit AcrA (membrane-fusion protein)
MKRRGLIAGLAIGSVAVAGACWFTRGAAADVPTAKVERGSFIDAVQIRGEIKAGRSVTIIAPSDAGELRIVKLVRSGTVVKKGDVLIEFDGSTVLAHPRGETERGARVRSRDGALALGIALEAGRGSDGPDQGELRRRAREA